MDDQHLIDSLGERVSPVSSDPRETTFLYQRISLMLIQIFTLNICRGSSLAKTVTED